MSSSTQETRSPTNPGHGKNILNDTDIVLAEDGHGYIFNPYNPDNREITLNDVQSILSTYGVPSKLYNFELLIYSDVNLFNIHGKCFLESQTMSLLQGLPRSYIQAIYRHT